MAQSDLMLTESGKKKYEEELRHLETIGRAEVGERIRVAREFGDISENSEYDDAKNEQAKIEARIAEISQKLRESTVVNVSKRSTKVNVGSTVTVIMNNEEKVFNIVGDGESDITSGKISYASPVGGALMGGRKGEKIVALSPHGAEIPLEIVKIVQN